MSSKNKTKTDYDDVSKHIDEILENLKDLRPVFRQLKGFNKRPETFEKPVRRAAPLPRFSECE